MPASGAPVEIKDIKPRSTAGFLPPLEYRRMHDLITTGDNVPEAMQTFESVGFPPDILDEVSLL